MARLEKQIELQQKQMQVLERMIEELNGQARQPPVTPAAVEELQAKDATLEARSQQAAQRDQQVADQIDRLNERMDARQRYEPQLPAPLKELFLPSQTVETPLSIYGQFVMNYDQFQAQRGQFDSPTFSPYFLLQASPNWLLLASLDINHDGMDVGEAQFNYFATNWLTVVGGRYLTPIGYFNERLNHEWINKLPDPPLMFLQVSPLSSTNGVEIRGAHYIADSPVKLEYSLYGGNGFELAQTPQGLADIADLEAITGGPDVVNAKAIGGRLGLWVPAWGFTAGASGYYNPDYIPGNSESIDVLQFDAGFHKGDWDVRFRMRKPYQQAMSVIGQNIHRRGLYAQVAYRPNEADSRILRNLEIVYRYSMARF